MNWQNTLGALVAIGAIGAAGAAGCETRIGGRGEQVEQTGSSSAPLIGGQLTTADPAVVALTRSGSRSFCTGTLISPSVILTAAHCIDMAGEDPSVVIFFGSDLNQEGVRIGVKAKKQHIGWTGDLANGNDIGMLLLNFPAPDGVEPIPMNTTAASDLVGTPYRVTGFGVFDQANQIADGKKRTGEVTIASTRNDNIIMSDNETIVCFGDSGGPGFVTVEGVEYVAGVHSWTSGNNCGPPNGDTRVDLFVSDVLLPWIQDNDPTCKRDGQCANVGCTDDPDCTPCGPDGTCTADCPLPDVDCATSALGEICQADSQCTSGLCVFWQGDPGTKFCTQLCSAGACPSGMSCQDINPFGDVCYYDEDPPGVLGDTCNEATDCGSYICDDGLCVVGCDLSVGQRCPAEFECKANTTGNDFFCYSTASEGGGGGCQSGGGGPGSLALLGLALLMVWPFRRRGTAQ